MSDDQQDEHAALVALFRAAPKKPGSWLELSGEIMDTGSAVQVWADRHADQLSLIGSDDPLAAAWREVEEWEGRGFRVLGLLDADYPARLRGVFHAPPILFAVGELRRVERSIAIVGSRKPSAEGLRIAEAVATELANRRVTVVSGLAKGIDTAAHRAALAAGGRTVAVLGTGLGRYYPAENRQLQDQIAETGLVLSQFWPDTPPQKHTFPMRNAVMSGYAHANLIVEATENSGTRHQARAAWEHGRRVILIDRVVEATQWGKDLATRPGVTVAADLDEAVEQAELATTEGNRLLDLLAEYEHTVAL